MRNRQMCVAAAFAAAAAIAFAACGSSSSSSSTSPSSPATTPSGAVASQTITISNNTATPKNIIAVRGTQVTFINNDTVAHNMFSDPHPEHTDCLEINSVGFLAPGQTRRTDNLVTNRTVCGFHDHDLPNVAGLQGSITIQ